jgi:hypothetical protein
MAKWQVLSKLWERHGNEQQGRDLRFTDRDRLEGWSFRSIADGISDLDPKMVYLEESGWGWVDFIRSTKCLILMGSGFGEILHPRKALCKAYQSVPTGQDYLACRIASLRNVAYRSGHQSAYPGRLTPNTRLAQREGPVRALPGTI